MFGLSDYGLGAVIYVGIFLGVLLLFEGLRQLLASGEDQAGARNRRMRMIARGASPEQVLSILKPTAAEWRLAFLPVVGRLPQVLRHAGVSTRPQVYLALCVALWLVIAVAGAPRVGPLASAFAGLVVGVLVPVAVLGQLARRRLDHLTRQLPDALDLMSRGLRVGHPLNTTIQTVARDMADPVASEFGVMVDQIAYGADIVDAFADFAQRIDTEDAHYLATSVAIQNGTGSDLAKILVTLSKVIRGRITMRKRIHAISSEGRLTATFLSCLPFLIVAATSLTSPEYYPGVAGDPLFKTLALIALSLITVNYLVMRRLVNFRI